MSTGMDNSTVSLVANADVPGATMADHLVDPKWFAFNNSLWAISTVGAVKLITDDILTIQLCQRTGPAEGFQPFTEAARGSCPGLREGSGPSPYSAEGSPDPTTAERAEVAPRCNCQP